jgi:hypothetical protein
VFARRYYTTQGYVDEIAIEDLEAALEEARRPDMHKRRLI